MLDRALGWIANALLVLAALSYAVMLLRNLEAFRRGTAPAAQSAGH